MRLTDISVRALPHCEAQKTYTDDSLPGFGVRVSKTTKTFVVVHGPTRERVTIGRFPTISLSDARQAAKHLLAERILGKRRPKVMTYDEAKSAYLEMSEQKHRSRTHQDYKRFLDSFAFGKTHLADITKHDIRKRLEKRKHSPTQYDQALRAIKTFFTWAVRQDYLMHSPCEGLQAPAANPSRTRALTEPELRTVLKTSFSGPYPFGHIVALCILTGQRRGEIAKLQWDWIDRTKRTITLPATVTKNKREHTFPYGEMAERVIAAIPIIDTGQLLFPAARDTGRRRQATVFNGWSKAKRTFDNRLEGVGPFTLHDLRRTLSTQMASLGIPQIVVEKLLNHVSGGTQSPIAQVYNRHSYLSEMREAIDIYECHLAKLLKNW
ncbi:tyrosine-type recombinase/integrase [Mesorhizobium sp. 10J20-29]